MAQAGVRRQGGSRAGQGMAQAGVRQQGGCRVGMNTKTATCKTASSHPCRRNRDSPAQARVRMLRSRKKPLELQAHLSDLPLLTLSMSTPRWLYVPSWHLERRALTRGEREVRSRGRARQRCTC
jgi:hypothetical protein